MALFQWEGMLSPTILPSLLFAFIFLALILKHFSKELRNSGNNRGPRLPPGPSKLPIIGNLHQLGGMPHISLWRLSQKFGPIIHLKFGEIPTVVVSSAAMAMEVMKTHDLVLSSRPQMFSAKQFFYNCTDIAFAPYGPYWRHVRKICILELLSIKRVQSFRFVREQEVERLVRRIALTYPNPVNLSKMLGLFASDVLCQVALGKNFSEGGEYDKHGFQKMLEEFQILLGGFSLGDFFPSMEWINSINGWKRRLQSAFKRFDRFFDEVIEQHLNSKKAMEENKDLVDVLLELQKNGSLDMPLTMDNIKAIIMDMFVAGTDTTFITLDWGMTELIINPRVMRKAQDEVRGVVRDRKMVQERDLPQLHYMKAVIKETFRLHPPAPVLVPRESIEEVTIGGYVIPSKTRFFVNAWAIGRDSDSWQNPEVFEPERFIGSSIDYKGLDFELIPFGSGRRICPAISFGTASVELALAQLLHSFDWELPHGIGPKDLDMTEVFGITMHRTNDLMVVAKPRFT
ncbi:cytochrome P450 71AP13-like [Tasmannia lanceolata]|uniref:cytochrome P450 71AP13-like n=1 Tax=Tasmannia lanceolata TaxID=3420 RepID=UPI004063E825